MKKSLPAEPDSTDPNEVDLSVQFGNGDSENAVPVNEFAGEMVL